MQPQTTQYIISGIVAGMILFILLSAIILSFVFQYQKKQKKHQEELTLVEIRFEKQLLQSQVEIQEQTFNHISQEIHDNVGQILSLAKIQLNILGQQELVNREILTEAKETLSKAIIDLRDIAKRLSTERAEHFSMVENIMEEFSRIQRSGLMNTDCSVDGQEQPLRNEVKTIVFRVIQECLQNIIKHSSATKISMRLHFQQEQLRIVLADNGKGFDVTRQLSVHSGLGLQNIIQRTAIIGGQAIINSQINQGTTITLTIPYV